MQHAFASQAGRPSGKNALIKRFRPACGHDGARVRLERLAEVVHAGLKGLAYPWDVWLLPAAMHCLGDWRAAMDDPAWGQVGAISRGVIGGRPLPDGRLPEWRLGQRGFIARP